MDSDNIPTPKLLDDEAERAKEHRVIVSKVVLEIEDILLRENMSVGDLLEIFALFTNRANRVFERITIKEIKKTYAEI